MTDRQTREKCQSFIDRIDASTLATAEGMIRDCLPEPLGYVVVSANYDPDKPSRIRYTPQTKIFTGDTARAEADSFATRMGGPDIRLVVCEVREVGT
jgi:hypothetical protein